MGLLRQFVCLCFLVVISALQDCNSVFSSFETFTGKCNNKWTHVKPLIKRKDHVINLFGCFSYFSIVIILYSNATAGGLCMDSVQNLE